MFDNFLLLCDFLLFDLSMGSCLDILLDDMPHFGVAVDLEDGVTTIDCCAESQFVVCEDNVFHEPFIGMEFESEDAAKEFYDRYARRVGFIMRIDQCRRSELNKRILSRRLSCNKKGYYVNIKNHYGPPQKARTSTREGCKAMMLVKVSKSGKWVVTRFVKEHTHPLVPSGCSSGNAMVINQLAVWLILSLLVFGS